MTDNTDNTIGSDEHKGRLSVHTQSVGTLMKSMQEALEAGDSPSKDMFLRLGIERVMKTTTELIDITERLQEAHRQNNVPDSLWSDLDRVMGRLYNKSSGQGDVLVKIIEEPGASRHTHWRWLCGKCASVGIAQNWSLTGYDSMENAMDAAKGHIAAGHSQKQDILIWVARVNGRKGLQKGPFHGYCGTCNKIVSEHEIADEADRLLEKHRWKAHPSGSVPLAVLTKRSGEPLKPRMAGGIEGWTQLAEITLSREDIPWERDD